MEENKEKIKITEVLQLLKEISECIDDAIENEENDELVSEIIDYVEGIAEDNWMYLPREMVD